MPARAYRRTHAVLGVRVGVGQSSREETAARVAAVIEADAAMGIVAASRVTVAVGAPDRASEKLSVCASRRRRERRR
jgi:hypothetical protein